MLPADLPDLVLEAGETSTDASAGELLEIPPVRHALHAYDDAVVLLTVTKRLGDGD